MNKILSALIISLAILSINQPGYSDAHARQTKDKLIIYYFHTTIRCSSCILIEELTRFAVTSGFSREIKNGRVELKIINIDEPNNSHYAELYKLPYQSVILSKVINGAETKWKNLTHVWDYLREEDKFKDYVQKEIKVFLNDIKGMTTEREGDEK